MSANHPQKIVLASSKSVGISLILTFLFGPLGMLYSTIWGGLFMLAASVMLALGTAGGSLFLTWVICMVWGVVATASANKRMLAEVTQYL